ncbi:TonB-dependent siderophore receptor [Pseudomonas sp. NPDC089554]|uniref:TonB-dependent siderophore receptor n=1 Tax=Pseudomonas sp. NPDC089554 TaxID=3390653 RepID=UPI003D03C582
MKSVQHASMGLWPWQKDKLRSCTSIIVLGLALGMGSVAQAQEARVNIPAMPLNEALTQLGHQTGLQFLFEPGLVSGKRSAPVSGTMEPSAALETLLRDANLTYRIENDTVILSSPKASAPGAALELGATSVVGQGMGEATENSGSYTTGFVSVGSKTPVSLKDTPQSVSIISQKLIEDTRSTSLQDAMRRTPGITLRQVNYNTQAFYSRGFGIDNLQIDGAAPMDIGTGVGTFYSDRKYDLAAYDHVEILRGASGLLGGTGDPGGIVNLVRKRPLDHYQLKLNTSAGSWDNYRSEIDLTGPLAFDGKLRGRMVAAYTDRQYFMDVRATERPFLYGILEADITDDTMLTFGGSFDKNKETGTGDGLPRYAGGGDVGLPRHTWFSTTQAWADSYTREWFAKVDHYFNEDWKLNASYTYSYNTVTTEGIIPYGWVDEYTNNGPYWWGSYVNSFSKQDVFDVNLSGNFEAFGRRHELLVGADHQKVTSRWRSAQGMLGKGGLIDLWNPGSTPLNGDASNHNFSRDYSPNAREQYGLYSTLRLQLTDPLKLVVGARAQRYKYEQGYSRTTNNNGTGAWIEEPGTSDRVSTKLVPYGGLIYALNDEWSTYVSYAEVFKPQSQRFQGPQTSRVSIEPMEGKNYETGIKGELFDGRMNVSAALFYTKRENQAVTDPRYPSPPFSYSGSCCFLAQDKVTSKGIDLEATGEIMPGWEVMAGYTFNLVDNSTQETIYSSITPKHLFKLWTMYTLPGSFSDFRVGGGVTAQSAAYVDGLAYRTDPTTGAVLSESNFKFSQGGYAVYDAMVEYKVDDHWTVAVNGNNLFDRRYYSTVNNTEYGNYYGEPRNFMLTLRGTFD